MWSFEIKTRLYRTMYWLDGLRLYYYTFHLMAILKHANNYIHKQEWGYQYQSIRIRTMLHIDTLIKTTWGSLWIKTTSTTSSCRTHFYHDDAHLLIHYHHHESPLLDRSKWKFNICPFSRNYKALCAKCNSL